MFGDPEKDQPELNVLKAIYEVRVPQSVKGQIQIKNGLEILRAGLDPDMEANSLALQLSPQLATIANFLNDFCHPSLPLSDIFGNANILVFL